MTSICPRPHILQATLDPWVQTIADPSRAVGFVCWMVCIGDIDGGFEGNDRSRGLASALSGAPIPWGVTSAIPMEVIDPSVATMAPAISGPTSFAPSARHTHEVWPVARLIMVDLSCWPWCGRKE
uniref:Uncharacterized protein n=1 Tax=Physcomitrium patens TaxID=3218 RepID=A0A2K1JTL6_PHYPA|nr:hypothetical protein PHYPA_014637 [Physcomitrium patens]